MSSSHQTIETSLTTSNFASLYSNLEKLIKLCDQVLSNGKHNNKPLKEKQKWPYLTKQLSVYSLLFEEQGIEIIGHGRKKLSVSRLK